jgi:hypothetical protein
MLMEETEASLRVLLEVLLQVVLDELLLQTRILERHLGQLQKSRIEGYEPIEVADRMVLRHNFESLLNVARVTFNRFHDDLTSKTSSGHKQSDQERSNVGHTFQQVPKALAAHGQTRHLARAHVAQIPDFLWVLGAPERVPVTQRRPLHRHIRRFFKLNSKSQRSTRLTEALHSPYLLLSLSKATPYLASFAYRRFVVQHK